MTATAVHECHDCGQFQVIGHLRPGQVGACLRCGAVLRRRRRNSLGTTMALSLAGLSLLAIAALSPIMAVRITGQDRSASLLQLPIAFEDQDMPVLAIALAATTLLAPLLRLLLTAGLLAGLRLGLARNTLTVMARLRAMLTPWAMIEVFLLGLFVAYSRLEAIAAVQTGVGLYALGALMLVIAWADTWLDEDAMWDAIGRAPVLDRTGRAPVLDRIGRAPVLDAAPRAPTTPGRLIGCDACGLASRGHEHEPCPRCGTPLRHRKPQVFARTWALLLTAAILYVPANVYPVLTVVRLGRGAPSTIIGGVQELIEYRMWPLAALVFVASILVPMLKLVGLSALLILAQRGSPHALADRTRIFRLIDIIGRWSMIDVFMVAILTALVRMGAFASVTPGYGAVAFALVVVLTMLAALSFDPRVAWDRAAPRVRASTAKAAAA